MTRRMFVIGMVLPLTVVALGCGGIRCTRTVRWTVDGVGMVTCETEYHEDFGRARKPPVGWAPDQMMVPGKPAKLTLDDLGLRLGDVIPPGVKP